MKKPLGLFQGFGVELEYMIVHRETLDVMPICDKLMEAVAGEPASEFDFEHTAWSNELVLHVVEIKTLGPAPKLEGLAAIFQNDVRRINSVLESMDAMLLPTAMHPWMNPERETRLWPHENGPIYQAYDRVFGCKGHGWSNLQSTHINLPFNGDEEFGRLHAAIRLILPILPALAASSPIVETRITGADDNRLLHYQNNQKKLPVVAGQIIPEDVYTQADYERRIFAPIMDAIRPHDPEGILEKQFLNSRGAIARFERGAIEIRLLDIQESPGADLAILALIVEVLRALIDNRWTDEATRRAMPTEKLAEIFRDCVVKGHDTRIDNPAYLAAMGASAPETARQMWQRLFNSVAIAEEFRLPIGNILAHGNLSRRIVRKIGPTTEKNALSKRYRELATALQNGELLG